MNLYLGEYIRHLLGIQRITKINLIATWKCDSRCITCQAWKRDDFQMSWGTAKQILECEQFKHVKDFHLEGGEPTQWDYFLFFVEELLQRFPETNVGIPCNGLDTDRIIKTMGAIKRTSDYKRIQIGISINGIGDTHDKIRGVSGGFNRTVATLVGLKDMGYNVSVNFLPLSNNFNDIPDIKRLCEDVGVPLTFVVPSGSGKFRSDTQWADFKFTEYIRAMSEHTDTLSGGWKWAMQCFLSGIQVHASLPCYGGRSFIAIYPNGNITPCIYREDRLIGKVTDTRVDMLYNHTIDTTKCMYPEGHLVCGGHWIPLSIRRNIGAMLRWKLRSLL